MKVFKDWYSIIQYITNVVLWMAVIQIGMTIIYIVIYSCEGYSHFSVTLMSKVLYYINFLIMAINLANNN